MVFGFLVAASLFAAACGGDAEPSDESITADSTADDTTSDTTADRDRNVQVGGWGAAGTGYAETKLYDRVNTSVQARAFRRVRTETNGSTKVLNTRDVFLTWQVVRTTGGNTEAKIVVAGYDPSGADPTQYPIAAIGGDGTIEVALTDKGDDWYQAAASWTVVSRNVLAVFTEAEWDNDALGVVEYYNLSTGELDTTYGDAGRTVVPRTYGMSWVEDFALRKVDDDGTPHFVVVGPRYVEEDPLSDVIIAGFTPDASPDPQVGGEDGSISIFTSLDTTTLHVGRMFLADPALGDQDGDIGVVVRTRLIETETESDQGHVTALNLAADRATGVVSGEREKIFAELFVPGNPDVAVGNVWFESNDRFSVQLTTTTYDDFGMSESAAVAFTMSETTDGPRSLVSPGWSFANREPVQDGDGTISVSSDGKHFASAVFRDVETRKIFGAVCFDTDGCRNARNPIEVDLIEMSTDNEKTWSSVESLAVDSSGAHVVVRHDLGESTPERFGLVSFSPAGVAATKSLDLDARFGTFAETEKTKDDPDQWEDEFSIARPMATGGNSVFAPRYDRLKGMSIAAQNGNSPAVETKISLPLGVSDISSNHSDFARLDADSTAMVAHVVTEQREERRIYIASLSNGSVETGFGAEGYVVTPQSAADDDDCARYDTLVSTDGAIANVHLDYDRVMIGGQEECSWGPVEVAWSTYATNGAPIGAGSSRANLGVRYVENTVGLAIDAKGNLYSVENFESVDEEGRWNGTAFRIVKFGASGERDARFGVDGVVEIIDPRFGWRGSIAIDSEGRVYLATTTTDDQGNPNVYVARFTATGGLDVATAAPATTAPMVTDANADPTAQRRDAEAAREEVASQKADLAGEKRREDAALAALPANSGLTIATDKPVLASVKAVEDRSLTATWTTSAAVAKAYVTATAMPGGRS